MIKRNANGDPTTKEHLALHYLPQIMNDGRIVSIASSRVRDLNSDICADNLVPAVTGTPSHFITKFAYDHLCGRRRMLN